MANKKTVVFDFDGVIHSYTSGWKGIDIIPDEPVFGIKECIDKLKSCGYEVIVVSTRCSEECGYWAVVDYLCKYQITVDGVMATKPPAVCYVDDRAICFKGNSEILLDEIQNFKSWMEK